MDAVAGIGMGLLWAVLPTAIFLALLWWIDKYEREPLGFVAIAVLLGVGAMAVAAGIEALLGLPVGLSPHTFVVQGNVNPYGPAIEEGVKGLALLAVFFLLAREFDDTLDGIVYGAALGAGFALVQNFAYYFDAYGRYAGLFNVGWGTFVAVALGGLNHSFYTAVVGAALGYVRASAKPGSVVWLPVVAFPVAMGLHILHDYLPQLLQPLAATWPANSLLLVGLLWNASNWIGIILMGLVVAWAWGRQSAVVESELAGEIATGVVTAEECSILSSSLRRLLHETECLLAGGLGRWHSQQTLYNTEVELAFAKWHASQGEEARWLPRAEEDRARIRELRRRLTAAGGAQ